MSGDINSVDDAMLRALLAGACRNISFYHGLRPNLGEFPIINKQLMRLSPSAFLDQSFPGDRTALLACLHGSGRGDAELQIDGGIIVEQTSGTNGLPFRFPKTKRERVLSSLGLWAKRKSIDPEASPANFYPVIHRTASHAPAPRSLDALQALLNSGAFRWLHANPPLLIRLAHRFDRTAFPSLKFVESSGQYLSTADKLLIEESLGVQLVDQYGCREVWAIGYSTQGSGFELLSDNLIVEIVDERGNQILGEADEGRIIVTSLHQTLFPFIRYDTGDRGYFDPSANGKRVIILAPSREHTEIVGGMTSASGTEVFKSIMVTVHRRLRYPDISYLQVRQVGLDDFIVIIEAKTDALLIVSEIENEFNRAHIRTGRVRFASKAPEFDECRATDKVEIFTSRDCRAP